MVATLVIGNEKVKAINRYRYYYSVRYWDKLRDKRVSVTIVHSIRINLWKGLHRHVEHDTGSFWNMTIRKRTTEEGEE